MHSSVLVRNQRLEGLGIGFTVSEEKEQLPPEVPAQLRSPGVGGQVRQSPGLQAGGGAACVAMEEPRAMTPSVPHPRLAPQAADPPGGFSLKGVTAPVGALDGRRACGQGPHPVPRPRPISSYSRAFTSWVRPGGGGKAAQPFLLNIWL